MIREIFEQVPKIKETLSYLKSIDTIYEKYNSLLINVHDDDDDDDTMFLDNGEFIINEPDYNLRISKHQNYISTISPTGAHTFTDVYEMMIVYNSGKLYSSIYVDHESNIAMTINIEDVAIIYNPKLNPDRAARLIRIDDQLLDFLEDEDEFKMYFTMKNSESTAEFKDIHFDYAKDIKYILDTIRA